MMLYVLVSSFTPETLQGPGPTSIRIGPAHRSRTCHMLCYRRDSSGRVLEVDESIVRSMFPELGRCKRCAKKPLDPPRTHTLSYAT